MAHKQSENSCANGQDFIGEILLEIIPSFGRALQGLEVGSRVVAGHGAFGSRHNLLGKDCQYLTDGMRGIRTAVDWQHELTDNFWIFPRHERAPVKWQGCVICGEELQ